ncbi:hypothetical protein HAX54_032855 [Datura stramonium]|uniref:Secreted protein n=1 Tax=Datura stramonium TaxID=4076 RepID=A0ABS8VE37_DATST|nr:hypothetical protein [Datura stramonium]
MVGLILLIWVFLTGTFLTFHWRQIGVRCGKRDIEIEKKAFCYSKVVHRMSTAERVKGERRDLAGRGWCWRFSTGFGCVRWRDLGAFRPTMAGNNGKRQTMRCFVVVLGGGKVMVGDARVEKRKTLCGHPEA